MNWESKPGGITMKQLFDCARRYLVKSDWKDLAMIKLCVFSVGILAGTYIVGEAKGVVRIIALVVFVMTMIPIMIKLFSVIRSKDEESNQGKEKS